MQYLTWADLDDNQKSLLETAKIDVEKLVSQNSRKVGYSICDEHKTYKDKYSSFGT